MGVHIFYFLNYKRFIFFTIKIGNEIKICYLINVCHFNFLLAILN